MKIGWVNLLEDGTVTVTSSETLYPSYRLYDRIFGRMWKATSTSTQTIQVDQGASGTQAIDALVIPSGHNLHGCNLQWQYSDNGSAWSDAVTDWTQSGSGIIVKQATASSTHRYWKLEIAGASSAPYCAEVFMTLLYTFSDPLLGLRRQSDRIVTRQVSYTGFPHVIKQGRTKRQFNGSLVILNATDLSNFETFMDAWDGSKPFYITDFDGNQYFAEFTEEPERTFEYPSINFYSFDLRQVS